MMDKSFLEMDEAHHIGLGKISVGEEFEIHYDLEQEVLLH
jgi:hypothetical protein